MGSFDTQKGYPRIWIRRSDWNGKLRKWVGKWHPVHRLLCEWEQGEIPTGWTVDHECGLKSCLDHLGACTRPENTRRERERERGERPVGHPQPTQQLLEAALVPEAPQPTATDHFEIALFTHISRPVFERRAVDLADLVKLLTTFVQIAEKKQAPCWSPTRYLESATSRSNAGVDAVSALVFDLDRVPPDHKRLNGICWIGHTTWSHRHEAPRWRVVIPLAQPVASASWSDVWQRARAALCPEADPVCKDASRAYWVPSHAPGVQPEKASHAGPLLNPDQLPALQRQPNAAVHTNATAVTGDRRRGEAYMTQVLDNLAAVASGGRNAGLNRAAWTLGHWVAAGALEQSTVEEGLYAAAEQNGLVADDGERQAWATIRSGLSAGLQQPMDLDDGR
jgi:hypothetical protein